MPTYRIEESKTARAGCKNKECKDNKVKIGKGELRFGTWVETADYQSWHWKHWGCVTPKVIGNLADALEGDFDQLDGYDEISSENQDKIREAVEERHVADSDWKGDVEMNRAGKAGFRVPTSKKAKAEAKSDGGEEPQKKKKSKSKRTAAASEEEEAKSPPKKAKAPSKKGKTAKSAEEAEDDEDEPLSKAGSKQSGRGKKRKVADDYPGKPEDGVEEDGEPNSASKKHKAGRKSTKATAASPEKDSAGKKDKDEEEPTVRRSKRRTTSRKKSD